MSDLQQKAQSLKNSYTKKDLGLFGNGVEMVLFLECFGELESRYRTSPISGAEFHLYYINGELVAKGKLHEVYKLCDSDVKAAYELAVK